MSSEFPPEQASSPHALSKEENDQIWETQNFLMGCLEMERITDEIVVPYFQMLARPFRAQYQEIELILMDCESPLDQQIYNLGVRLSFDLDGKFIALSIVADPSSSTFSFNIEGMTEEPVSQEFKFYEVIPRYLNRFATVEIAKLFPEIEYIPEIKADDVDFESYRPPYRVQYDDHGNISDVATTQTIPEAASMGSTFAKMFNNEKGITILDSADNILC